MVLEEYLLNVSVSFVISTTVCTLYLMMLYFATGKGSLIVPVHKSLPWIVDVKSGQIGISSTSKRASAKGRENGEAHMGKRQVYELDHPPPYASSCSSAFTVKDRRHGFY